MQSSRMHTARWLPVSPSMHLAGGCLLGGGVWSGGCLVRGCLLPGGCLLWRVSASRGVSALGVSASRGEFAPGVGGCLLWGVSAPVGVGVCSGGECFLGDLLPRGVVSGGGVCPQGGVCSGGGYSRGVSASRGCGIPACSEADTPARPWTESQTPVKTVPWPNFVAAGNKLTQFKQHWYGNKFW